MTAVSPVTLRVDHILDGMEEGVSLLPIEAAEEVYQGLRGFYQTGGQSELCWKEVMALGVHTDLTTVLADLADHGVISKTPRYFPSNPETQIMWEAMGIELPPIDDLLMSRS